MDFPFSIVHEERTPSGYQWSVVLEAPTLGLKPSMEYGYLPKIFVVWSVWRLFQGESARGSQPTQYVDMLCILWFKLPLSSDLNRIDVFMWWGSNLTSPCPLFEWTISRPRGIDRLYNIVFVLKELGDSRNLIRPVFLQGKGHDPPTLSFDQEEFSRGSRPIVSYFCILSISGAFLGGHWVVRRE